jgi:hypothetical protein
MSLDALADAAHLAARENDLDDDPLLPATVSSTLKRTTVSKYLRRFAFGRP